MAVTKERLLYVYDFLFKQSDERHPLSTTDLIELLERVGIHCNKKSIYSDIETLKSFGYDIMITDSPKRGYFLVSRTFELPEVRLLIDAVQSASFITPKKTQQLLNKLETLTSGYEAKELVNQIYIDSRIKCKNERIYYSIDCLHNAIVQKRKVTFVYVHKAINLETNSTVKERRFTVSPYALVWNNDHYYLVCNYDKYNNTMNLRIDKMKNVEILTNAARPFSDITDYKDQFNTADYVKKQFNMFTGTTEKIELVCDLSLLDTITDQFGDDAVIRIYDSNNLLVEIEADVSDGLVSWIMQYGDKIRIQAPESLLTLFKNKLLRINKIYCVNES